MDVMFAVDAIHSPGVEKYQQHKDVDRSLLRKPESELKSADSNFVELFDEKNAKTIGTHEPNNEAQTDEPQVGSPVSQAFVLVHECSAYCYGGSMYQGGGNDLNERARQADA
jgi:hypothetical protein